MLDLGLSGPDQPDVETPEHADLPIKISVAIQVMWGQAASDTHKMPFRRHPCDRGRVRGWPI
jgi:hypothetical protein